MIKLNGSWVEDSPRKDYLYSNLQLLEVLKIIAIPAIIIITAYIVDNEKYEFLYLHREKIVRAMQFLNVFMVCALILNGTLAIVKV